MLTVGLDLLLIPRWGVEGAAAASTVAYVAQCVFAIAIFRRQTQASFADVLAFRAADFAVLRQAWGGDARA